MKSLVVVALLVSPAVAEPRTGEGYTCLHDRRAARPHGDHEPVVVIKGTSAMDGVIRNHIADVETCWLKVPAARRSASAAVVHLAIEGGMATSVEVTGELPAGVATCVVTAANRWAFPLVDGRTELEHAIQFNAR